MLYKKVFVYIYLYITLSYYIYLAIFQEKRRIAEEARRKQEQDDAKLAQRLQADENRQDGHNTSPHLLNAVCTIVLIVGSHVREALKNSSL